MTTTPTATKKDTGISLPTVPTGKELEDYLAAALQASGHYVEKNVTQKEVLELDIAGTDYASGQPEQTLYEAKGGDWGFKDIFKLMGQMNYLSIERGRLIVTKVGDYGLPFYNEKMEPHGIEVVLLDDFTVPPQIANKPVSEDALQVWRYSFWIERILLKKLTAMAKSWLDKTMPAVVSDYRRLINDEIFFSPTGTDRADRLYEAYKEHPTLTLDCADDLAGTYPDQLHEAGRLKIGEAFNEGKHSLLQICMYLEQRARIAILKGAVDALCDAGGSAKLAAMWQGLPASFVAALSQLEKMPGFWKYPVFWQVFLWGWGGYLLTDQDELALVAEEAGLSIQEAEAALTAFDLMFPMPTGASWVEEMSTASYTFVKMVPWPFKGIGAYRRLALYEWESYASVGGKWYTGRDLNKWHQYAYQLLLAAQ